MSSPFLKMDNADDDRPRFAVIRLRSDSNLLGLFQLLLCNGFGEVAFVKSLNDACFAGGDAQDAITAQQNGQKTPEARLKSAIAVTNAIPFFHFGQSSTVSKPVKSNSPLPLATFSCPLPLPIDRPKQQEASVQKSTSKPMPTLLPKPTVTSRSTVSASRNAASSSSFSSTQPIIQKSIKEEQSLFVSCHLCNSKIMATRFSNLTNHVRRHASCKQFQCCYCDYAHNEIAKVRLHMANNHGDKKSRPINNINTEMQDTWRRLMRECFPERCKRQKDPKPMPAATATATATAIITGSQMNPNNLSFVGNSFKNGQVKSEIAVDSDESSEFGNSIVDQHYARCDQCYAYVNVNMKESHIRSCHMENIPNSYVCSLCGLENTDRNEVEMHIRIEHDGNPHAQVINADLSAYIDQMINEYFPVHAMEYTTHFDGDQKSNFDHSEYVNGIGVTTTSGRTKQKCNICKRQVGNRKKHVRRHLDKSFKYYQCPVCVQYRSNCSIRVQRHMIRMHGGSDTGFSLMIVGNHQISPRTLDMAILRATNRCFGSRRYPKKKFVHKKTKLPVKSGMPKLKRIE